MSKMYNINSWDYMSLADALPREWNSSLKTITSNKQHRTSNTDNAKQLILLITTGNNQTQSKKQSILQYISKQYQRNSNNREQTH